MTGHKQAAGKDDREAYVSSGDQVLHVDVIVRPDDMVCCTRSQNRCVRTRVVLNSRVTPGGGVTTA